jgi:type II secretory pathway pseudopilin PulG
METLLTVTTDRRCATRKHSADRQGGFTIVETVVAAAISLILAAAIITVILSSMNLVGQSQLNAVDSAKSQAILTTFENVTRDADQVKVASGNTLVFNYRAQTRCERHTYQFGPDPKHSGRLQLTHMILALTLPGSLTCAAVDGQLSSGAHNPQTTRVEASNLAADSGFTYYASTGQHILRLGDPGFNPATNIPTCQIGSVAIALSIPHLAAGTDTGQSDRTQIAFRNNARGLTC